MKKFVGEIKNIRVGMILKDIDWEGPSTVVIVKIENEGIMVCRLNPTSGNPEENCAWFCDTPYGDERLLLLEGELLFGGI